LTRTVYLQITHKDFLQSQGNLRLIKNVIISAHRGKLLDRNNENLAISTPINSIWINPQQIKLNHIKIPSLLKLIEQTPNHLINLVNTHKQKKFLYLKRHISPELATQISALKITGVFLKREYRRYYPAGKNTAHIIGFTNIDDIGQEGLELSLNKQLRGIDGNKRIIQDNHGNIIEQIGKTIPVKHGKDIKLSIDKRLHYFVSHELQQAMLKYQAKSISAVILDVKNSKILAIVNQPNYNPNNRQDRNSNNYRNRAITDVFEPGSTMKPFIIAAALESGKYNINSTIDTFGGLKVKNFTVKDPYNYGRINLAKIIQKSSNVGASKLALSLSAEQIWDILWGVGFGASTESGLIGEVSGNLAHHADWYKVKQASLAFGYGLNVTLLQLAKAYMVLANGGIDKPVSFLANSLPNSTYKQRRIMSLNTSKQIIKMMEGVVSEKGTANKAQVKGYRIAGKTGTVRKIGKNKTYTNNSYLALFVGIAPADNPRLVMAVIVDEAQTDKNYGGELAAPIFAKVMQNYLPLL
jgi:cell division protein FtsI (penicillin-binding protein 3)